MTGTRRRAEQGQALILIVFGLIGLVAITGLAIDGGNAYSDRRNAQNAADTAALATGLTSIRHATDSDRVAAWTAAQQAGFDRAAANGYSTSDPSKVVHVYTCDQTSLGADCQLPLPLPTGDTAADYIQVTIRSTIPTYFAPVLGIRSMTNFVQAVVRAVPPVQQSWYDGNALVALMPGCKPSGWPDDPFTIGGTSNTTVLGISGIFVNSNCGSAFSSSNNVTVSVPTGSICVVGGGSAGGNVNPAPQFGCGTQVDTSKYALPPLTPASCTSNGQITGNSSSGYFATPGNYSSTFPDVSPAGILKLGRGIYCLNNGSNAMSLNSGWTVTTDLDGDGLSNTASDSTEGVVFYIPNGGVKINGGATVQLSAEENAVAGALKGYLIYLPPTNSSTVSIEGGGASELQGTILAPAARVTVSGNSSTQSFHMESQIIGYSVGLSGNGNVQITYNQSTNGKTWTQPALLPFNSK